jgi:flagellar hook-length control protein FliK
MDILTGITPSTPKLTAAAAKDTAAPNDQFNAVLANSMSEAKISMTTATENDKPVLETPAVSETVATLTTDSSGQNMLTMLEQINAYKAASADKDSPVTPSRQSRNDSLHANPAIAMTVAAAIPPIGATTDLAKSAPLPITEPSHQALALDKLTAGHGKTEPADTLDTATAASVANAPLLTLTPTHLAAVLMPLMDAPQTTVAQASVNTLFGKSGWAQAVGQQVMVMVKEEVQTLNLTLNPPNLGPLQVVVKIENQVANVQFSSATLEVQQALRSGLPILQEMFGQAGVALGQTDIGYRQPQRDPRNKPEKHSESSIKPEEVLIQSIHNAQKDPSNRQGLVNLYA